MAAAARLSRPQRALAALVAVAAASLCGAAPRAAADFRLEQIAPGVFVHQGSALPLDAPGHDDIANIGFIVGRRCVAVIDTGGSVRTGRALRTALRAHTALPVCYVINTHVHVDHVLGNAAFVGDRPQFVGHAQLPAALTRSREFFLASYAGDFDPPASAAQLIMPTRTVAIGSQTLLDLGGRRLRLTAWPSAHTDCDLSVLDLGSGTLWSGDLLFVARLPVVDGSIRGWLEVLDQLALQQVEHVVPGHGPPQRELHTALAAERAYLGALAADVRAEIRSGKSLQETLREVPPPDAQLWQLIEGVQGHNVARVYQELEWE